MKSNPLFYLMRTGWHYAGRYKLAMVAYLLLFVLAQSVSLCDPYIMGRLLNTFQAGFQGQGSNLRLLNDIYFLLALYFFLKALYWAFHGPARVIERLVAFNIKANYKSKLFSVLVQLPLKWHRAHHSGESIDQVNRATTSLSEFFADSFGVFCPLFSLVGVEIILYNTYPLAFWISLGTTAVALVLIALFDRVLYEQYGTFNKFESSVARTVHDYISNVISIIALSLQNRVVDKVKGKLELGLPLVRANMTLNETKWCITTVLTALMTVAIMSIYAHDIISAGKVIQAGTFIMLIEYLRRIGDSFYALATFYGSTVRRAADVHSADPLLAALPDETLHQPASLLPETWQHVEVKSLHFTYHDERLRMHHLENVNVDLRKGKSIALVGRSGSGKSTFLNLLRGLHTADRVEVECDGVKLQQGLSHLAKHITLMPQEPELFADTIRFNIGFGLETDESQILAAVKAARFETVLDRLPNGLDTSIAENGVNLSGGEKQRLALARGFYFASDKDSDIILLDEPTSSVDTYNEKKIYQRLIDSFRDKCIVSSVHKLHLAEMFDMIYVFEDGKIAESGDFNSLLIAGGVFAQMWQSYVSEEPGSTSEKDNLGNLITLRDRIEKRLARNSSEKQESKSAEI
jgi:ABC-type multidrug transport system fused ATPase/permease subunit